MPCKLTFCSQRDWVSLDLTRFDLVRCDYELNPRNNLIFANIRTQHLPNELSDFLSDIYDCALGDCFYGIFYFNGKLFYRFDFSDNGTANMFKMIYSTL